VAQCYTNRLEGFVRNLACHLLYILDSMIRRLKDKMKQLYQKEKAQQDNLIADKCSNFTEYRG
jgi:hypothetical protein